MAFADTMIALLEAFLQTGVGVGKIKHPDGRDITLDRKGAMEELAFWKSQKDLSSSTTGTFGRSRLGLKGDA
jgi:hypothetical protein